MVAPSRRGESGVTRDEAAASNFRPKRSRDRARVFVYFALRS